MKKFTEIRESRRSAQDRLSARAAKHGLGSQKRLDKIKKASDFFSKPPPSFSKDELKKMGYAVESSSKVPAGMKFIASYVYKDAKGKDHTHRHLRKGSKMSDPVVVYIDDKEWKTFQSFTKAKQAAINHIKGMKESVETNEGMFDEASSPEQQAAIAIAKKADKVVNEDINVKSIDMFKTAAKDFDKKKTTKYDNFDSISDALSTIALQVRMLSKSTSGRTDVKAEKIISKQETRINNIINKTMYGKGGATEEGREIKKILSKHGLDRTFNGLIFDSVVESADAQFDAWYKKSQELDKMQSDASAKLKKFPKGNMGLVPDSVKKDPKYRKIKSEADKIFKMIQHHNKSASKDMLRMARDRRRQGRK